MTYEKIFKEVKKAFSKADAKAITAEFAFQFNITGEGEGIFYAAYKNGVLSVEPYDYKDRDVIFTADGNTLVDIANGKTEPIEAIKAGKLYVDGDHELAKQIMFLIAAKKPAAKKAAAKPAAKKPEAKPTAKTAAKPAAKAAAKPAAKAPETKPAAKAPEAKAAAKPAAKPAKSEETKPAAPAAKPAAPAAKAADTKPAAPAAKTAEKPAAKPADKAKK